MSITLKTVAEAAGVSIRTAGRVLRGGGPVSGKAAERVREAAAKLSYVPNAAARNLRRKDFRIVGVVSPESDCEIVHTRLRMLEAQLRNAGRHTLLAALPPSQEKLEQMLLEWNGFTEYVIFMEWNSGWNAEALLKLPLRCIFLDTDPGSDRFDRLLTERSSGVRDMVRKLIRAGCRKIAHVSGLGPWSGRMQGFDAAVRGRKDITPIRIPTDGVEFEDGYRAGGAIVRSGADAVFFDTDRMALGFYRYAHEHRIRIPDRISAAGFDSDTAGAYAIPALSTVAHPVEEEIRRAVRIVSEQNPARKPETLFFPTKLIARESIRRNAAAKQEKPERERLKRT